jgi:hypothetical protein
LKCSRKLLDERQDLGLAPVRDVLLVLTVNVDEMFRNVWREAIHLIVNKHPLVKEIAPIFHSARKILINLRNRLVGLHLLRCVHLEQLPQGPNNAVAFLVSLLSIRLDFEEIATVPTVKYIADKVLKFSGIRGLEYQLKPYRVPRMKWHGAILVDALSCQAPTFVICSIPNSIAPVRLLQHRAAIRAPGVARFGKTPQHLRDFSGVDASPLRTPPRRAGLSPIPRPPSRG